MKAPLSDLTRALRNLQSLIPNPRPLTPILLLAFFLRLFLIHSRPLWYDEAFSVLFAERGLRAMLYGTLTTVGGAAAEEHPLVYYTALDGWMRLAGQSPLSVRLLSTFAGVLTIVLLFDVGRQMFGARSGLVAAGLAAVSPFHVYYSEEARMYAVMALGAVLTVWFLIRATRHAPRITYPWLGLTLAAATTMYIQSLAGFFLLALGLSTLPRPRIFRRVALAGGVALALYLPWLLQLPGQFAKLRHGYWIARPTFTSLVQTLLIFHTGEELLAAANSWLILALAAGVLSLALLLLQLWRGWREQKPGVRWAAFSLALATGPPLLMFLASLYQPVYIQRALLPSALMYYLAVSWAVTRGGMPRPIAAVLLATLGAASLAGLVTHYTFDQFPRPSFPAAIAFLDKHSSPADAIVHSNKLTFLPMRYYDRDLPQSFVADAAGSGSDTLAFATQQVMGVHAQPDIESAVGDARHVWFVIFDRAIDEYRVQGEPTHPHLAWLQSHYRAAAVTHFGDLAVYEFVAP
ncbi:MAG: glycosyltransferase family 39 protein [Chloroflexi bacterium]|nr:glycosyltransferase family 39 protein [Chloroflexota bacterium]